MDINTDEKRLAGEIGKFGCNWDGLII